MDKYLSIITNFGCHYNCPYCIVKNNNLHIPKTTLHGLSMARKAFDAHGCNILSLSGGGDPLYQFNLHEDWYTRLFREFSDVDIEMHTSYLPDDVEFPFDRCKRVVYHCHTDTDLSRVYRMGNEIVRVVFVVTGEYSIRTLMDIADTVHRSSDIDELSFRQLVNNHYDPEHYLENYLKLGHKKLWWYIEQNDYNVYYAENKVAYRYRDICEAKA